MAATGLLESFAAAIQASLSVLLVIFYGGLSAQFGLLPESATKAISKVCVRVFLPALLFTKIGSELHAGSAHRYGIVLVWALVCHAVSFVLGIAGHLLLGMPDWTTVAVMFNNTTSYPLLLIDALEKTGILQALVDRDGGESTAAALERAKSYFLVFSTVSSCLTFAVGPRLIDSEHAPEPDDEVEEEEGKSVDSSKVDGVRGAVRALEDDFSSSTTPFGGSGAGGDDSDAPRAPRSSSSPQRTNDGSVDQHNTPPTQDEPNEATCLLDGAEPAWALTSRGAAVHFIDPFGSNAFFPSRRKPRQPAPPLKSAVATTATAMASVRRRASVVPRQTWRRLSPRAQWWLLFVVDFFNLPLLGALAGVVVGLTPALHRAFFSDAAEGGIFTAWLTASLDDIGGLFVPLPVVVAGVSLYTAMQAVWRQHRAGGDAHTGGRRNQRDDHDHDDHPELPWRTATSILLVRFVLWPLVAVGSVYQLASKTTLLGDDPMLWFTLMLMPTGPPAMKLITLVQVSNADAADEHSIAQLLTISYLISPILSFTVVASLRASLASVHA
ncbi:Auxin efflux carrier [Niveomyces insectorum RCEF 264]|uniref:Auxin efflux carrier n=1 Tax=Niveomyces insectorum RCEF 264 TaxID=1081102 RepID=A0A167XXE1_9HYPO|nr:Auxin efflux carrier [Niveomyces insectorum RCEF 264]